MVIDPLTGVWIGLAGSLLGVLAVGWLMGLFHRPRSAPPEVAAE